MMIELVLVTSSITLLLFVINEFRAYYFTKVPEVFAKSGSHLHQKLVEKCSTLLYREFVPTFWAFNGHLQTWLKTLVSFNEYPKITHSREYLQMEDDGFVSIDWVSKAVTDLEPSMSNPRRQRRRRSLKKKSIMVKERPILLIIPNALNTNVEDYADLCILAINKGFKPIFFNRRGYSRTLLTTCKVTTYNDQSDLEETLKYLNSLFPFSGIYAVAFSMESGNLISYLGQHERHDSLIAGAVCISSTFGCESQLDEHAMKQPYNSIITEKIKTMFQGNAPTTASTQLFDNEGVEKCQTMVSLQNEIHARCNDYETLKEYLNYNNPLTHLRHIEVPVLFIHAKDDPIVPEVAVPYEFFGISDWCIMLTTEQGGHCGFFKDSSPTSWADEQAVDFLKFIRKKWKAPPVNNNNLFPGARARSMTIL